jgi:hypothetical protein
MGQALARQADAINNLFVARSAASFNNAPAQRADGIALSFPRGAIACGPR